MEKIPFDTFKTHRSFQFPNGKVINVYKIGYQAKIDLENETYIPFYGYKTIYNNSTLPTISNLIEKGIIQEVSCLREYTITLHEFTDCECDKTLSLEDFKKIQQEFKENGFEVSLKGLYHNYYAWLDDFKSGYKCKKSFIFTPCGCNTLSFNVSSLHKSCKEWQITYKC